MPDLTPMQLRLLYRMGPERAISFLESLGVEITWDWKEQLQSVRRRAFTVAKVAKADALQTLLDELRRAQSSGVSYDEWKKSTKEVLERKGYGTRDDGSAWRLDTIYRTNMQTAYQAGRYERMQQTSDRFEFWEYRAVGDRRTRPKHKALDGLILPKDDPFWNRVFPPNGYRCRCSVTALTRKQALRKGYKPPDGDVARSASGETIRLRGKGAWDPDQGFEGVPGQQYEPGESAYDPAIRRDLEKDLGGG